MKNLRNIDCKRNSKIIQWNNTYEKKIVIAIEKLLFVDLNFSMMRTIAPEQKKMVDFSIISRHITSTHQPVRLHTRNSFEFKNKFKILYRNESRLVETTFSKWSSWEIIC